MKAIIALPLVFTVSYGYFTSDAIFATKAAAQAYCEGFDTTLASIHDFADLVEAQTLCRALPSASGTVGCWLGLQQASESSPWLWDDGTPFDYGSSFGGVVPWNSGEPNGGNGENCLHIATHVSWNWNDLPCNGPYSQYALCNSGCSSTAVKAQSVVDNKIYACSGTIDSGGVYGDDAEALCADGYHVCKSAIEVTDLGLTTERCASVANSDEFFATQETSDGNLHCYSYNGGDPAQIGTLYNDIWGCAERDGFYSHTSTRADECGPLTGWVGQSTMKGWIFQGNGYQEAVQTVLNNAANGGVLCCVDSCASVGASYDPSHFCRCESDGVCDGGYCHDLDEIASFLDKPQGKGFCPGDSACCCSCPDCGPGFVGFAE